ncbi:MAG: hypothetical protein L3J50_03985 [Emcibacter sp.]|nr:hypothetical protein [Emcibacter sp.]
MNRKLIALDIEVYPNLFLLVLKGVSSGKTLIFKTSNRLSLSDRRKISSILLRYTTIGFNSNNYDIPLINLALSGADVKRIYEVSKDIVTNNLPFYQTYKKYNIERRNFDHIDIKEPSPAVMISLKNYGTRIGSKKLQDLPYDPHKCLSNSEIEVLIKYCVNDVDVTIDLYNSIKDRIELREKMSIEYGIDLRSKSDAQIAEAVMTSELESMGINVRCPTYNSSYVATYVPPSYISFKSDELNKLLQLMVNAKYEIGSNGAVKLPKELNNYKVTIGGTTYKIGIGGLHSQEKKLVVEAKRIKLFNADFASYYPSIIINNKLYPKHLDRRFLTVYKRIVDKRLMAKRVGDKLTADSLKIVINGLFGKFGSI